MANPFSWTESSEETARLLADGELTQQEIADQVGIHRTTIHVWQKHPEFVARVESHLEAFRAEVRRIGLATREKRVRELNERHKALKAIVRARGRSGKWADVPGGETGLLLHRVVKTFGRGENKTSIEEWSIDAAILAELRAIELQAAKELGQLVEKSESKADTTIKVEYADGHAGEAASGATEGTERGPEI